MSNYAAETYRIAEEAHKGADDDYIRDLCAEVGQEFGIDPETVYCHSEADYVTYFYENGGC